VAGDCTLEIVEGPGAGTQRILDRPIVIGRAADADLVLDDTQVSRHHARLSPATDGSVVVEDLGSANGTFINNSQVVGRARLDPGDELLIGVTVFELHTATGLSAVRTVPPALAAAPRQPMYVNPDAAVVEEASGADRIASLDKYLDVRVRRRAQLAPVALLLLVALALIVYFATR
jgi:predicted component of type VI protein secretion system